MFYKAGYSIMHILKNRAILTNMKIKIFVIAFSILLTLISNTNSSAEMVYPDSAGPDNSLFTQVLRDHVKNGAVDYKAIKQDHRFAEYIEILKNTNPEAIAAKDRLAFWLNVYNAFTVKVVIDQYPINSIMNKFKYALKQSNFHKKLVEINGQKYSLNDVEHNIIRPYGDARIHFALVCAAKSCPPLRREAYEPDRLDEQLNDQARIFLRDTDKNFIDFQNKKAEISSIFDWFKEDFEKNASSVLEFISRYLPEDQSAKLQANSNTFEIEHKNYNWDLNDIGS